MIKNILQPPLDKENTSVSYDGVDVKIKRAFVKLPSQNIGEDLKDCDEVLTNKNLIFEDSSDLPYGWSRFKERRLNSAHYDRCILTSCGTRIDRQKKLDEFISLKALDLNINFSGSGRETLGAAQKSGDQGAKRKLVQQDISSFLKTDSDSASLTDQDPSGPVTKKLKSNVVGVLAKGVANQDISARETDVDGDESSSQDSNAVPSAGEDSVESVSETLESSGNIVPPSEEITSEDLPTGWTRKQISKAFRKNETVVVVQTPDGKQFDCQKKLNSYIARNKLNIKVSIDGPFDTLESKKPEVKPSAGEKAEVEESEKREKRKVKKEKKEKTAETDGALTNKGLDEDEEEESEKKEKRKVKKEKKERTAETDGALTNKELDEDEEKEELTEDELNYISEIKKFLKANQLALSPTPPTKGDGNCWFRAVAEQVEFHQIPDKAKNYRALRLEVRYFQVFMP